MTRAWLFYSFILLAGFGGLARANAIADFAGQCSAQSGESDIVLLAKARSGDKSASEALYQRHYVPSIKFMRTIAPSTEIAEDITQDVLIRFFVAKVPDFSEGNFTQYLKRSLANRLKDYNRKAINRHLHTDPEFFDTVVQPENEPIESIGSFNGEWVANSSRHLPNTERQVIDLHHLQGLTFEQIAKNLDEPTQTIKSRYRRGIAALRKLAFAESDGASQLQIPENAASVLFPHLDDRGESVAMEKLHALPRYEKAALALLALGATPRAIHAELGAGAAEVNRMRDRLKAEIEAELGIEVSGPETKPSKEAPRRRNTAPKSVAPKPLTAKQKLRFLFPNLDGAQYAPLHAAILALPSDSRIVFELRMEGESYDVIAAKLAASRDRAVALFDSGTKSLSDKRVLKIENGLSAYFTGEALAKATALGPKMNEEKGRVVAGIVAGLSHTEIAARLGITRNNVGVSLFRAVREMPDFVRKQTGDPQARFVGGVGESGNVRIDIFKDFSSESFSKIPSALIQLESTERAIVLLRTEGYGHEEIAAKLGISVASSRVRLMRAVRKVKEIVQ